MIDSTKFHEVYNETGEILQNVPPDPANITTIVATVLLFGIVLFFQASKKYNFSISK